jgi:hypothetical protein
MTVFCTSWVLFFCALVVHLIVWKIRLPKFHTCTLLMLFALVFVLGCVGLVLFWQISLAQFAHVALYYTALSLSYVITYSAFEGDSPTLSLIRHLDKDGAQGLSTEHVEEFLAARPFIRARVAALVHDGFVRDEGGRYFPAGKGSPFFKVILLFRKFYGEMERGG